MEKNLLSTSLTGIAGNAHGLRDFVDVSYNGSWFLSVFYICSIADDKERFVTFMMDGFDSSSNTIDSIIDTATVKPNTFQVPIFIAVANK